MLEGSGKLIRALKDHCNCKNTSSSAIEDRVVVDNRSCSAGGIQGMLFETEQQLAYSGISAVVE